MRIRRKAILLLIVFILGSIASCAKRQAGETPEQFRARKKAIYSAQIVSGLFALSDLTEILVKAEVTNRATGSKLIDINERALAAADTLRARLKTGWDSQAIGAVRNVLQDIERARQSGVITFGSQNALDFYFSAVATVEVSLNLVEALEAGSREPSMRAAARRASDSLQAGSSEPKWWNSAIVKATEVYRIFAEQAAMDAATAWADADSRSALLHSANKSRLEVWKS